ncbi:DUF397 domain-containing protein [Saccharothrix australiensis]|uniref:Uncharacterized protein DUF397 n=1 Tax=Saccharothrix australiensis TaxID=2072 RepID=A0A495VXT8_9PSEU|nr:DUF397 domain-containing protein [Saccharothrix australiensis]RKT54014.1 uncharacterized protein DUF397 [Saccharothrix australiensis]
MQSDERLSWRKSSRSMDNPNCVELVVTPVEVRVRDTKQRQGGTLRFSSGAFAAFLTGLKTSGE